MSIGRPGWLVIAIFTAAALTMLTGCETASKTVELWTTGKVACTSSNSTTP